LDSTIIIATSEEATAFDNAVETVVGEEESILLKNLFDSVGSKESTQGGRLEFPQVTRRRNEQCCILSAS
jgi:hypothetical protein